MVEQDWVIFNVYNWLQIDGVTRPFGKVLDGDLNDSCQLISVTIISSEGLDELIVLLEHSKMLEHIRSHQASDYSGLVVRRQWLILNFI